jgi:hypothetical protein
MRENYLKIISCACFLGLLFTLVLMPGSTVHAVSPNIVISQIYCGGGNSGATYTNDFIELFNLGPSTVNFV